MPALDNLGVVFKVLPFSHGEEGGCVWLPPAASSFTAPRQIPF